MSAARADDGGHVSDAERQLRRQVADEIALALDDGRTVACVEDVELFDLAADHPVGDAGQRWAPEAVVRCLSCIVRPTCVGLADHADHGVYGGVEAVRSRRTREQVAARGRARKSRDREARRLRNLEQ